MSALQSWAQASFRTELANAGEEAKVFSPEADFYIEGPSMTPLQPRGRLAALLPGASAQPDNLGAPLFQQFANARLLARPVACCLSRAREHWRWGLAGLRVGPRSLSKNGPLAFLILILIPLLAVISWELFAGRDLHLASGASMGGEAGSRYKGHVQPIPLERSSGLQAPQFLVSDLAKKRRLVAKAAAASAWRVGLAVLPCAWLILA